MKAKLMKARLMKARKKTNNLFVSSNSENPGWSGVFLWMTDQVRNDELWDELWDELMQPVLDSFLILVSMRVDTH